MYKFIFVIVSATLISGCAAVPISQSGSQVREIQHDWATKCKFLGIVEAEGGLFYSSIPEAKRDMYNKVRNQTAEMGGNAFAITNVVVERGMSLPFAQADAYICPAELK